MRRVTITVEDDFPLFQYPPGERSKKAREWLQAGLEIGETVKRIEAKLDKLLAGQVILPQIEPTQPEPAVDPQEERMSRIAASLLDALEEFEKSIDENKGGF